MGNAVAGEDSRADFVAQAAVWLERGVALIGGCCRTSPAHIARLRLELLSTQALGASSIIGSCSTTGLDLRLPERMLMSSTKTVKAIAK